MKLFTIILFVFLINSSTILFSQNEKNLSIVNEYFQDIDLLQASSTLISKEQSDLIDSIQKTLISSDKITPLSKAIFARELRSLAKQNFINNETQSLTFLLKALRNIDLGQLSGFLKFNKIYAYKFINYFQYEPGLKEFLFQQAINNPDEIFDNFRILNSLSYSKDLAVIAEKAAPNIAKDYFFSRHPLANIYNSDTSLTAQTIKQIINESGRDSKTFNLIELMVHNNLTSKQLEKSITNDRDYLLKLIEARLHRNPFGVFSLEQELNFVSLKFVRKLNDNHLEKDPVKRFASVANFSAEELYTLTIYSEAEIFTSTFNGLFDLWKEKANSESLKLASEFQFRSFIRICSGFGRLDEFLGLFDVLYREDLMTKLVQNLEVTPDLSDAIDVANAIGSIDDIQLKEKIFQDLKNEYLRVLKSDSQNGIIIYEILQLIAGNSEQMKHSSTLTQLDSSDLFMDNKHIQQHLFYDDDDGVASFNSFVAYFKNNNNWQIIDFKYYILIKSAQGNKVEIYANKPKYEYEGQEEIRNLIKNNNNSINAIIHRGHSYYVKKSISNITDKTIITVLGSCGGYHQLEPVLSRNLNIHIVSSKQIGTMNINNPLLQGIAESIRKDGFLDWETLWNELELRLRNNTEALSKFKDYIPPHKNVGAIFIQTYFHKMYETQLN